MAPTSRTTHEEAAADVGEGGVRLYEMAAQLGIEGIVAKRAESPYRRGRTSDWIKIKTPAGKAIDAERAKWNEYTSRATT